MFSAWYGGLGPGLAATLLGSALGTLSFILAPEGFLPLESDQITRIVLFLMEGVILSCIIRSLRESRALLASRLQDLAVAKQAADEASQVKSRFLATMSHELRTPLTAISGYAELLVDGSNTQEQNSRFLKIITSSVALLRHLIDDILDLSKIEAGRFETRMAPFNLRELVSSTVELLKVEASRKGLEIKTVGLDTLPVDFVSDPFRLSQILTNVLGNAIKFTDKGAITVRGAFRSDASRKELRILVSDTGIGMNRNIREHLFELFVEGNPSYRKRFGGAGLGLAVSKRLAKILSGDLTLLHSEVGQGSKFLICIPEQSLRSDIVAANPAPPAHQQALKTPARLHELQDMRILVADDCETNLELFQLILVRQGAVVITALDGRETLEKAVTNQFDLILLDLEMPGMGGMETVGLLRSHGYSGPIIAITAHAMNGVNDRAIAAGFDAVVTKPLKTGEPVRTIKEIVSRGGPKTDPP